MPSAGKSMVKKTTDTDIEKLKNEVEEWKGKYLRALADYQNLEKRFGDQRLEIVKYASEKVIRELLAILDTFEKAQEHIKDEGLALGVKNFQTVLFGNGLTKIEVLGKKFDPLEMECIEVVEDSKADEVVEELRKGYRLGEKVIRVAQVKVGKRS